MIAEDVELRIVKTIQDEFDTSERAVDTDDFESGIDMLECERTEKEYEWMSDYCIPEGAAILLTDASNWTNRYYPNRDFVNVILEDDDQNKEAKCLTIKTLINKTLNAKYLNYYLKYNRARFINALSGMTWAVVRWEQKVEEGLDDNLNEKTTVLYDRFNYDIVDPRNVRVSPDYTYSAQDKRYVIIGEEKTYDDLVEDEERCGYFNLDKVKEALKGQTTGQTELAGRSVNKTGDSNITPSSPIKPFDVYTRYGKFWAIPKETNTVNLQDRTWEEITDCDFGVDEQGDRKNKAELLEMIVAWARVSGKDILIRFQPTPFYDCTGNSYRPILRGLCYPHPTKDSGLSDGKYLHEHQIAVNDSFNLGYDRQRLGMLPTLKGKKHSLRDNDTIYFAPEHVMELENTDDVQEFVVRDNMPAALATISFLVSGMRNVTSVQQPAMGQPSQRSGETATAIVNAQSNTSTRNNYKELTWDYTFSCDLYWMIIQMSYRFMRPETALKMLGEHVFNFAPDPEYTYMPVSSNIETEYNKNKSLQIIDQFAGRIAGLKHPSVPKLLNFLYAKAFDLYPDLFPGYKKYLLDEKQPMEGGAVPTEDMKGPPTSNQAGMEMSNQEAGARTGATGSMY